ncbi:MAG: membrane protein insertion efficiency factor YidD [Thermoguttaceae bacterium]|nr:membrane protein insertion efficiency factor YidD [Thermoguttaceae bacterium]MBQ9800485.1 membrane protein insertion efficiency factor YidD [Thermoguttaceae bacterium]
MIKRAFHLLSRRFCIVGSFLEHGSTFIVVKIVRFYQTAISPMFGPCCRFTPTCSQYCLLAVQKYGVFIGVLKTIWRILRCHPFSRGGYDPP